MSDKGHKINQFREIDEIWVGLICNMKPKNQDIEDAETILTAYLTDEVGKKYMLNERKLYFPPKQICIINRWYHPKTLLPRERLASGSLAQIIPDILLHEYDEYGHYIYGSQKMKQLKCR